ncbi:MAG: tetratricopeptide repeat protein [Desulfuromonadales bacterium]|nr:tetratricopeptide repeat protein [Desulfuromonadales bacterium]
MRMIRSYCLLLCSVLLLCGFNWGVFGDSCKEAQSLVDSLETARDEVQLRQTEAKIQALCPDGAAGHYVSALMLERVGNVDGAINEYRQALRQESTFAKASGNLGLLYAQQGRNSEASVELTRGLAASSNSKYHKALGRILADMKVYPLAIHHLTEAGTVLTRDPEVFATLAEIQLAMGQPAKALEEYGRALSADPSYEKAHTGIASIYLGRNEPDKALEELKKAEMANPQNRQIHLMMAGIYEKKGDSKLANYENLLAGKGKVVTPAPAGAISAPPATPLTASLNPAKQDSVEPAAAEDLDKNVELLKEAIKESPDKAAEVYGKLGNLYRSAGKDTEAIAAYKEAVYRNSTSSDVYLNLGLLHEKHANLDEAVVAYKQAIKVKPDNSAALLRLADLYLARGSHAQAVEQYSEFLKLKPDSPDIQLKLARILARNKDTGLAIDAYNAVLKSSPDNLDANREVAALYKLKGMNDKAVEHYKKALAQQKDDSDTRNALVSIYVKNKQYDEITELLKGAVELSPEDPNNHYKLGLIYEFRKDYDNAVASYKKAAELKPDHARAFNALGRLYMKTGKISEAKEALEAARKADPSLEETAVLLNNIRDEFSPEQHGISKSLRSSHSRKGRKGKRSAKSAKSGVSKKAGSSKKSAGHKKSAATGKAKSKKH